MDSALSDSYRYARQVTRRASSTFYLASKAFSKQVRDELCAVYAFCRIADDIADAPGLTTQVRRSELELLAHVLKTERYSEGDLLWPAFFDTIHRRKVPKQYFQELLSGVARDVESFEITNTAALERYSYLVAGTVGIICAYILGAADGATRDGACQLGIAMQLTNITRDVSADAAIGRVYLPTDLMKNYHLTREQIIQGTNANKLAKLLSELSIHAEASYHNAEEAISTLPARNQRPVRIALSLYRGILRRIEHKHFNVYNKRIRLNIFSKLWIVIRTR